MFIDFDDLTEESKKELLEDAREYGLVIILPSTKSAIRCAGAVCLRPPATQQSRSSFS